MLNRNLQAEFSQIHSPPGKKEKKSPRTPFRARGDFGDFQKRKPKGLVKQKKWRFLRNQKQKQQQMIHSNTHAIEILETSEEVPYEAIRYLYYQKPSEAIHKKVLFWLENAYNDEMIEEGEFDPIAPFWFAILAENYLDENLVDPVIKLFTTVDSDWDYLNEQAVDLIHGLCYKIGDKAITPFLQTSVEQIKIESELPYLYLFESFRFVDPSKYEKEILSLFEKKSYWLEALLAHLPDMQFLQKKHPELLSKLHEKLELLRLEYEMLETEDHIDRGVLQELINCQERLSKADYSKEDKSNNWKPKDWEATIRSMSRFAEDEKESFSEQIPAPVFGKQKKIGRNDPCPCGSGKKYKRCCL